MSDYTESELQFEDNLRYNDDIVYDEENYEIEHVRLPSILTKYYDDQYENRCSIPYDNVCISDLVLVCKKSDIECNTMNIFDRFETQLIINGSRILQLQLIINLVMAKLIDKEIKEIDNEIYIPLVLFNIGKYNELDGNKFPLYRFKDKRITIYFRWFNGKIKSDMRIEYRKYKLKCVSNPTIMFNEIHNDLILVKPKCHFSQSIDNLYIYDRYDIGAPSKFLIIYDLDDDSLMNTLEEVHLNHGHKSKSWYSNEGEIMKLKLFGRIVYMISLIDGYKSIKKMKKYIKKNIDFIINDGIEFHKTSQLTLKFTDDSIENDIMIYNIQYYWTADC